MRGLVLLGEGFYGWDFLRSAEVQIIDFFFNKLGFRDGFGLLGITIRVSRSWGAEHTRVTMVMAG